MDDEERKEQKRDKKTLGDIINGGKKLAKSKINQFKMWLRRMLITIITSKVFIAFVFVLSILAVLGVLAHIIDIRGSTDISDEATKKVIAENAQIMPAPNPDDGYYFQISDSLVEDYILELNRAYEEGHYLDHITNENSKKHDDNEEEAEEEDTDNGSDFVYDEENARIKKENVQQWFNAKEYEDYLVKFVRAEIASSYPKIGDYEGEGAGDSQGNKKDANRKLYSTRCSKSTKNFNGSRTEMQQHSQ